MLINPVNNKKPGKVVELSMTAPDECIACGWIAPKKPGDSDKWHGIAQFGPFVLLVCPKCGNVTVNSDWRSNLSKIEEAKEKRIQQVSSPLVIPKVMART